jgi:hypothetical protein
MGTSYGQESGKVSPNLFPQMIIADLFYAALGNSKGARHCIRVMPTFLTLNTADIVKMIDSQPDLASVIRRVRGGYLKIQGTWMPYEVRMMPKVIHTHHPRNENISIVR